MLGLLSARPELCYLCGEGGAAEEEGRGAQNRAWRKERYMMTRLYVIVILGYWGGGGGGGGGKMGGKKRGEREN